MEKLFRWFRTVVSTFRRNPVNHQGRDRSTLAIFFFYNRWFYKRQSSVLRIDLSRFSGGQRDYQKLANLRVFLSRRNSRLRRVEDASAAVAYAFRQTSSSLNIATQIQSLWEFARTTKGRCTAWLDRSNFKDVLAFRNLSRNLTSDSISDFNRPYTSQIFTQKWKRCRRPC